MKKKASKSMDHVKETSGHWEKPVSCEYGSATDPAKSFLPMKPTERPRPYKKVNELDY